MTSELKSETARVNGAKSRGPISINGRKNSSANAVQHGLTATSHIVIAGEDPAAFNQMLEDYLAAYRPANTPERDLVAEMVAARWRLRRLETIESGLLDDELLRQLAKGPSDPGIQLARSFRALADDSRALDLSSRYQARLHRIHDKAYQTLFLAQKEREKRHPTQTKVTWVDRRLTDSQPGLRNEPPTISRTAVIDESPAGFSDESGI